MPYRRASDRLRFVAVLWVAAARLALWTLPLAWTRRLAKGASSPTNAEVWSHVSAEAVGEAVRAATRAVPRATCLVQALAAGILLRRAGLPAVLCLGVPGGGAASFSAHAWVESDGLIVVGGDVSFQVPLARFDLAEDASWSLPTAPES